MKSWLPIIALFLLYKIVTAIPVEVFIIIGVIVAYLIIRYLYIDYRSYKSANSPVNTLIKAQNISASTPTQIAPVVTTINVNESEIEKVERGQYFHQSQNFSPESPRNSSVYRTTFVSGIFFRISDVKDFFAGYDHRLEFEREPNNKHDRNAIKVIGISSEKRYFIGYVPKDCAKQVVDAALDNVVYPRLRRIFCNSNDFYEVRFEIVGPSELKQQFENALNNKPADFFQKAYYKFFKITLPTKLTYAQAKKFILDHEKRMKVERPNELEEYEAYVNIFEEFEHYDFRKTFEIKKPTRKLLIEALDSLVNDGYNYRQLDRNIDFVCDRLIQLNRKLDACKD